MLKIFKKMFKVRDLEQIHNKGIKIEEIDQQINNFEEGFPWAHLVDPAISGNGIWSFTEDETAGLIRYYEERSPEFSITKFVPASGAATRMFKSLYEFSSWPPSEKEKPLGSFDDKGFNSVYYFLKHIQNFAFAEDLNEALQKNMLSIEMALEQERYGSIIDHLLTGTGLDYGNLPKGLLKFHSYPGFSRTSFGEHLVEGAHYAEQADEVVKVHLTVSPEHLEKFKDLAKQVIPYYEEKFGVRYDISFSMQKPSTDTIAVDMDNEPFRKADGSLLFRPGGHGALIENLNDLDTGIVFIKNIDNVVPDNLKAETCKNKKLLGGYLIKIQDKIFNLLRQLETDHPGEGILKEAAEFAKEIGLTANHEEMSDITGKDHLFDLLNRPVRICGMVKNEGEPGGGPFWVRNKEGKISLQIVESSQINRKDQEQDAIFQGATHFNPVDLVCGIRDYKGQKFDLHQFVDPSTGFISIKSMDGKQLQAQELPGLWNGAMAGWITLFVEVPIITFNPVKTVNDLLRKQHQ